MRTAREEMKTDALGLVDDGLKLRGRSDGVLREQDNFQVESCSFSAAGTIISFGVADSGNDRLHDFIPSIP
jgi:hypothetical protein